MRMLSSMLKEHRGKQDRIKASQEKLKLDAAAATSKFNNAVLSSINDGYVTDVNYAMICQIDINAGLEINNEKVKNNSIFNTSRKSAEFLLLMSKIKSREYQSMNNVKSILFSDSVNSDQATVSTYDFDANGGLLVGQSEECRYRRHSIL